MSTRVRGYAYRCITVSIDSYDNSVLKGRFYNIYHKQGQRFDSLMQFLLKMEQMLDHMNYPQSFTSRRTFVKSPDPAAAGPPAGEAGHGFLATFEIRILFRQNASWQGSLTWLEGEQEQSFRSVLELALLIDSALRAQNQENTA